MSAKPPMMCVNPECSKNGQRRTVLGGCEECFSTLVPWVDPDVPTINQISIIVCDVAYLDGRPVPQSEIENILRKNESIREMWVQKLSEIDWKTRLNEIPTVRSVAFRL